MISVRTKKLNPQPPWLRVWRGFAHRTHGLCHVPEFHIWKTMNQRCYNRRHGKFAIYGGRGITVCAEWRDSFARFYHDMGPRPSATHQLDRVNNGGPYEAGNCRWATRLEQARNRRDNHIIQYQGKSAPIVCWSEWTGIPYHTLKRRLTTYDWPVPIALTKPVKKHKPYERKISQ